MGNAQSAIQEQFNAHKCKQEESSQGARVGKEASEKG
jgi:hypothetical protein